MQRHLEKQRGDADATLKLFEILRGRYTEQFENWFNKSHESAKGKNNLQDLALFGITTSWERVFQGRVDIIPRL